MMEKRDTYIEYLLIYALIFQKKMYEDVSY